MVELVFLGINELGERVYDYLLERDDATVRALLTHEDQLELIEELEPDLVLSVGFRHIVPESVLEVPERGCINLHNSYLPHNRGANANVWSIVGDAPAGVSIHYMTTDVDGGPVIDRRMVPIRPDDDGRSLYERLVDAQFDQFTEVWPAIRDGTVDIVEPDPESGSYHYKQDFVDLWELELDEEQLVGETLDRLRALTYPPYKNAYFERDGSRYYVELEITPATEVDEIDGASEYRQLTDR